MECPPGSDVLVTCRYREGPRDDDTPIVGRRSKFRKHGRGSRNDAEGAQSTIDFAAPLRLCAKPVMCQQ